MSDTDLMPFGPHHGVIMENVPASYLLWLEQTDQLTRYPEVKNYIDENRHCLTEEVKHGGKLW
jgi:uncharacterized protein (DUF3820 family)